MKRFEDFSSKDVKKASPDPALAQSLVGRAERSMEAALMINIKPVLTAEAFEKVYESLRQLLDAILALDGYKSYSHVASIAYLQRFSEFTEETIARLDNARLKRNDSTYYARDIMVDETKEFIKLYNTVKPLLLTIISRKLSSLQNKDD
jgi:hypothetical protein